MQLDHVRGRPRSRATQLDPGKGTTRAKARGLELGKGTTSVVPQLAPGEPALAAGVSFSRAGSSCEEQTSAAEAARFGLCAGTAEAEPFPLHSRGLLLTLNMKSLPGATGV